MTAARDFKDDYSPGGLSGKSKRRVIAQRAGKVSGRLRRQRGAGRRSSHRRTRQEALCLTYRHRQFRRDEFFSRYKQAFPPPIHPPALVQWKRGRVTAWLDYRLDFRLYRKRGQHCGTTNWRRGRALELNHRPRCRRTVQRLHRKLEAMGLVAFHPMKRKGSKPGERDYLVMEVRTPENPACHPPAKGGSGNCPKGRVPALPAKESTQKSGESGLPPPSAADADPPDEPAERQITERERIEAAIRFTEQKAAAGWSTHGLRLRLHELRRQLRELNQLTLGDPACHPPLASSEPGSDRPPQPDSNARCNERSPRDWSAPVDAG